jgi:phospholipid/cholesterol/gamma-HCH transport system substrate-binding protein
MKIRHLITFIAFSIIVVYSVSYIAWLGVRIGPPDDRVNVSMQVADVNGLVVDSNVLLRGVPVGKVVGIDTSLQSATIHFYIDKQRQVPVDSEVRLENLSALGETYIGLMPRTEDGPMFRDGQEVATEEIKQPASISELAASVVHLLKQTDPQKLHRLVDEADQALPDQRAVLPNLTRASVLLRNTVMSMNGRGSETLANFQTLLQNAGFVGPVLAQTTPYLPKIGNEINGSLWALIDSLVGSGGPQSLRLFGRLLDRITKFLDDRAPDLKVIAETLMPNIQGIAAAAMNIDTGQILSNMLDAIPEDGTITLRVTTPNP